MEEEGGPSYLPMDVQLDDLSSEVSVSDRISDPENINTEFEHHEEPEDDSGPFTSTPFSAARFYGKKRRHRWRLSVIKL